MWPEEVSEPSLKTQHPLIKQNYTTYHHINNNPRSHLPSTNYNAIINPIYTIITISINTTTTTTTTTTTNSIKTTTTSILNIISQQPSAPAPQSPPARPCPPPTLVMVSPHAT
ncbi:hypothetical protein Pmani_020402 [Petrolisthes manimaculis]|uniref:Uncharacterized protein n=1 Tax=Petrolisthes manimaculis TaxID=1843537 RepID=A0AAE1PFR2_9EUCA|nr:hypothetical protein Pmani_020402 [Petrolisthes manimaculis]